MGPFWLLIGLPRRDTRKEGGGVWCWPGVVGWRGKLDTVTLVPDLSKAEMESTTNVCIMCLSEESVLAYHCCFKVGNDLVTCMDCFKGYVISEISICVAENGKNEKKKTEKKSGPIPPYFTPCHSWVSFVAEHHMEIRCPLCRGSVEFIILKPYIKLEVKSVLDIELVERCCRACLGYKDIGREQEAARRRDLLRTYVVPNILSLAGLRRHIHN